MVSLLTLILGLLIGFYGRWVYDTLKDILARLKDTREFEKAGIVRPVGKVSQPPDITSDSGGVRRLTPDEYLIANQKARDVKLK